MSIDLNVKKIKKNAYRITKVRNKTALRIRVPGGHLDVKYFDIIKEIAEKYGNGSVHITIRQGFEIPDIPFDKIDEINRLISPIIKGVEIDNGVLVPNPEGGYPSAGTRNISACIGNRVCPFANFDTSDMAVKLEKAIFPNDYHVKVAVTGCPNDCIKAHMQDFGVIGMVEPQNEYSRCIGCEACVKTCKSRVTGALSMVNGKVRRDERRCIGCGECVLKCPTASWTRNPQKFYRLVIMGRTGKKNPRLAARFAEWISEDAVIKIISNVYKYINENIDTGLDKEHIGYIVDRTGYAAFKNAVLSDVTLNKEAKIADNLDFHGYFYTADTLFQ